ncbi:MAG: M20 family metallo-hydrolase [Treponema sp.]|jgi:succinyl-diaminopimelate desuccinylase|nr:M20 family metallo-hydrolase [Treponema sp.]
MSGDFDTLEKWIDCAVPQMAELQKLLTSHKAIAPESGGDGELEKCLALESWLKSRGITALERLDAPDSRVSGGVRPNLLATIPGKEKTALWVMAHLDVVPEGELSLWTGDPWTVREKDGKLIGRGVEDNQQGLVSAVFAALAFLKTGIVPEHTIKLLFVADEEVGSEYGVKYLLSHHDLFHTEDLIIVPDGGDPTGETIETAEKNLLWLKITVTGKQSHGSRPDLGNNAHLAGAALALSLNNMERFFVNRDELFDPPYSTFQPTKKETNVPNINTIPGEDVFYMDCRILPCYPLSEIWKEIQNRVMAIEEKYNVKAALSEAQASESPATPVTSPVVAALKEAIKKVYAVNAQPVGIGGGTVAAPLRRLGFNAAVWSRLDGCAHQPDEFCRLENLAGDAKVFAAIAAEAEQ